MARIIEREQDAGGAAMLHLKIYRSGKDGHSVLGHASPGAHVSGSIATFPQVEFGTPADEALRQACQIADEARIPFVWIDDPNGLFPPEKRQRPQG